MLTESQLSILRHDLRTLAHIEYEEVENELLDHYATLTEQKMVEGQTFDQASCLAWKDLGEGIGLQQIQEDYEKNVRKQISTRHKEIVKDCFRWPTVLGTLLICGLMYQLAFVLSPRTNYIITQLLFVGPGLILLYAMLNKQHRHADSRKLVWQYLHRHANLPFAFLQLSNLLNAFIEKENKPVSFLQAHPAVATGLACVLLIYTLTFLQLYRERFYYRIAR